ncbi:hypothetical protein TARUN_576 [Trichoderma arundinaceum]|uniref:Uncharacterized protein n=1 Tax=Trichoderma arundinaceum TaxID=490622 RepID=A0A395NZU9_TRIAR|nr:hypothetical protein TARUN_576 [Trichoderma arundinaceum]
MPVTTPAHDVTKLMGRRNLSNIPKDQRSLLELEDSWAVELKDGPHGLATVPDHVLKTLKEAFVRLKDEKERQNPVNEEDPDLSPNVNDIAEQNGYSPGSRPARSSIEPPSSPERSMSWSQSQAEPEGHDEMPDPGSPVDEAFTSPRLAPLTQPPLHQVDATPTPGYPSNVSELEDLEMEFPQAQENLEAPINRAAAQTHLAASPQELTSMVTSMATTTDTPPCAQPLVPSATYTSSEAPKSSVLPADLIDRRPRRMKPISFSQDSPKAAVPFTGPAPVMRMSSMPGFGPGVQNTASMRFVIPSSYNESSSAPPSPHDYAKDTTPRNRISGRIDEISMHGSSGASPLRQTPMNQLYHIQAAVDMPIDGNMDPYGAFAATYPDYAMVHSGNWQCFIQACVLLRGLQEDRAIREYLYDDFIRAWSGGFLTYIQSAGPGQTPLPAIEWFNMLRGPILFNRMCVNKDNIDTVLKAYPEEVARITAIIDQERQQEKEQEESPIPEVEMQLEPRHEQGPEMERGAEIVDLLDSDSAMDINMAEERRNETQQQPRAPSPIKLPPPIRKPPSLPAPSRPAPPPPQPQRPSPELESDDFDSPPLPPKPPSSLPNVQPRSQSRPESRSRSQTHRPQPQSDAQSTPRRKPQPQMHLTLPERQSPRRHRSVPASAPAPAPVPAPASTAPLPSAIRRPPKSANIKSSPGSADYLGNLVSGTSRSAPSSSGRPIPKMRKRSAEERARLKEHFRKKASSSTTSVIGSGAEN